MDSDIPTFASWNDIAIVQIAFMTGFLPYISIPFDSMSSPYLTKVFYAKKVEEYN